MNWREQFREDNRLLLRLVGHKWFVHGYVYAGLLTVAYQASFRWEHCTGFANCSLSFLKAAIWGSIWPIYWINHVTDFALLRPYG